MKPLRPLADRFWEKVDRSAGPEACWPWTGARSVARGRYPYGEIREGRRGSRILRAHRVALLLTVGPPPGEDYEACHDDARCSTSLCCNPLHLRWDTREANMADWKRRHGRLSDEELIAAAVERALEACA